MGIASCTMDDMGDFKVVFEKKSGSDESTGKVTVKPKPVEKKAADENKKKEEKKAEPKPEPKPFKMPKKVEKKPEPEPEPVPEEPKKIVKMKKTERVQREWKDPEMETVKLAHHEFEKAPQPVETEGKSTVKLGQPLEIEDGGDDDEESQKKKRKKK